MKKFLLKIYNWPILSPKRTNQNQKRIRDVEWEAISRFVKKGNFLDVGCGAGYAMTRAKNELNCTVFGIDPNPFEHGVGRNLSEFSTGIENITKAFAEKIPFEDNTFDVVYSSHVLEHVHDVDTSLKEMKRVLKRDGVLIIGMPTRTMAVINWITHLIFRTHFNLVNLLLSKFIKTGETKWWELFMPRSHGKSDKAVLFDIKNYSQKAWQNQIEMNFEITEIVKPSVYPYPEYLQWFKPRKSLKYSSSIFFICHKK